MGLNDIASRIDETLDRAEEHSREREARFIESDSGKMAHNIIAYVLERAETGHDPFDLGASMVQGACIGEDESGGYLAAPVVEFLESLLDGAKSALAERQGADEIVLDPVAHCVQYYLAHNRWPESASPTCIAKAKAAMVAGMRGSPGNNGAAFGLYL